MYGYHPEIRYEAENSSDVRRVPAAEDRVQHIHNVRDALAKQWSRAVERQRKYYNQRHTPMSFKSGDKVLLSTANLKQDRPSKKLANRYLGPFVVDEPVGSQAYRLFLPTK